MAVAGIVVSKCGTYLPQSFPEYQLAQLRAFDALPSTLSLNATAVGMMPQTWSLRVPIATTQDTSVRTRLLLTHILPVFVNASAKAVGITLGCIVMDCL